jgi:glutathione S-transferase
MNADLTLVSIPLCPYVQRAAIVLAEKDVPFERRYVDLAERPAWFTTVSPLGKVPLLMVGDDVLFESSPIVEYLEETEGSTLHPSKPIDRAKHRAWMEFGSAILADIWIVETTADQKAFDGALAQLRQKFTRLEQELGEGPFFAGARFSLVDAVFAPVFRYFDVFEEIRDLGVFKGLERIKAWRRHLAERASVRNAVVPEYSELLKAFLKRKAGILAQAL